MANTFSLYTITVPNGPVIPYVDIDPVKVALGDQMVPYDTHTFTMKEPICEALNQECERMVWAINPMTGRLERDPSLMRAATIVAYLQSWSLPHPLTMDSVGKQVHPALVSFIAMEIEKRVYPGGLSGEDFTKLSKSKPQGS